MTTQLDLAIAHILRSGSAEAKIGVLTGMGEIALAQSYADLVEDVARAKYHHDKHPTRPATAEDRANSLFELDTVPVDQEEYNRLFVAWGEASAALSAMDAKLREMADERTADHDYAPS
jgi:hypothetical protein